MKLFCALAILVAIVGCKKDEPAPATQPPANTQASSGPRPIGSPALGGMTPMTDTDSVEGSGGGSVGFAAKDMARNAAGAANSTQASGTGDE